MGLKTSASTAALLAALAAGAAQAQESDTFVIEELVVTAQKREERLIDVPQSISVVTGDQIQRFNLNNFGDIAKITPGMDISGGTISLRGVKFDPLNLTRPTVDTYFNETPALRGAQVQAQYDVGQIEIVRGPQGTLRAGTGPSGAVLITTRAPDLDQISGYASASYSDLKSANVQGGVSLPIIPGKLGLRLAGLYDQGRGGRVRNVVNGARDRTQTNSGRISLRWTPTDDVAIDVVHQKLRARTIGMPAVEGSGAFGDFTADDRVAITDGITRNGTDTDITTVNAHWDVAGHRVSYVGGDVETSFRQIQDSDTGNGLLQTPFGRLPVELYVDTLSTTRTKTHELRFERTGDHFWIYRFGAFHQEEDAGAVVLIDFTGANGACRTAPGPLGAFLPCTLVDTTPNKALIERGYFTTQTFNLTDKDTIEVGLRRSETPGADATTGTASYRRRVTEDVNVYATWGRGFRPGGEEEFIIQQNPQIPADEFGYDAETSDSYELGLKASVFDGRLQIAAAAFYQKFNGFISNAQGIVCTGNPNGIGPVPGTVFATSNGAPSNGANPCGSGLLGPTYNADASARGVELDLRALLRPGWTAQLGLSYADAHFDDAPIPCNDFNGDGQPDTNGIPAVQAGRYFSRCISDAALGGLPKWQVSFNTDYNFALGPNADGYLRGLVNYKPSAEDPNSGLETPETFQADVFAGLRLTRVGAAIELFARNVFNEQTRLPSAGEIYSLLGAPTGYRQASQRRPREVGVVARLNF